MKTNIQLSLDKILTGTNLERPETEVVMNDIMTGQCTEAQIAAWLTALRMKGETADEIAAGISIMRNNVLAIKCHDAAAIDIVGTGGDGIGTWNISTAAVFVAAGAGVTVAKHGNRALSSQSGSADVLASLGINTRCSVETMTTALNEIGVSFLFAPLLHPAMKYAVKPRQEIGIRTLFNLLGPMTNPAGVERGLIGVFSKHYCRLLAAAGLKLNGQHMFFVHGLDGLDEASVTAPTYVCELHDGQLQEYEITPEQFGLKRWPLDELLGGQPRENALELKSIFEGKISAYREAVILNAALGMRTSGKFTSVDEAVQAATASIDSGQAKAKLNQLIEATTKV